MKAKYFKRIRQQIHHYYMWEVFHPLMVNHIITDTSNAHIIYGRSNMGALIKYLNHHKKNADNVVFSASPQWVVREVGTNLFVKFGRLSKRNR